MSDEMIVIVEEESRRLFAYDVVVVVCVLRLIVTVEGTVGFTIVCIQS